MKKRGQLIYKAIFVIFISLIIVFFFIYLGKTYGTGEASSKLILAKDIALTVNALLASPGESHVVYPCKCETYTIHILLDTVTVYNSEIGESDPTAGKYKFITTNVRVVEDKIINPKSLVFDKKNDEIKIKGLQ